jgi:hypothetical protein
MNHWPFIIAAYLITAAATLGIYIVCAAQMRSAEQKAEHLAARRVDEL